MSEEQAVLVERRNRVMIITLNRPDAMNAINGALSNGLWNAIQELDNDDGLTAGVITGNGRAFCAGMDLKAFARGEDIGPLNQFVRSGAKKPLIGAINGFALAGGCELCIWIRLKTGTGRPAGIAQRFRHLQVRNPNLGPQLCFSNEQKRWELL